MSEEKGVRQFAFFESYQNAIDHMPTDGAKLQMYQAITQYMFNGVAPDFQGEQLEIIALNVAWELVVPILNKSLKRSIAGSMGKGIERPSMRGNQNAKKIEGEQKQIKSETKQNLSNTKQNQANQNYKDRIGKEKEKDMEGGNAREERAPRFTPTPDLGIPSIKQVADVMRLYCKVKGIIITEQQAADKAERFINHHQASGWVLSNGRKMKDWEAAARNWIGRDIETGAVRSAAKPTTKKTLADDELL